MATPVAIVSGRLFEVLKSSCGLLLVFDPAGQRVFRHMGPHGLGVGLVKGIMMTQTCWATAFCWRPPTFFFNLKVFIKE